MTGLFNTTLLICMAHKLCSFDYTTMIILVGGALLIDWAVSD